jgi:hypothetical protein
MRRTNVTGIAMTLLASWVQPVPTDAPLPSRPRLDTHQLGVITLEIDDDRSAARFLSALAEGHPERYPGFIAWASTTFEVFSSKAVDVGLDGGSLVIEPPLSFSIHHDRSACGSLSTRSGNHRHGTP